MITVLCANAGMDKTYEVEGFRVGGFHHPTRLQTGPGGKGVNVARVLRALGTQTAITGFVGGAVGQYIVRALRQDGVSPTFVKIAEESRLCVNVIDPKRGTQTRVDEAGPLVTPSEIDKLRDVWEEVLARSKMVVISGSAPRGVPFDLYGELILPARRRNVPVILDAHDEMLSGGVQAGPTVIKPNLAELRTLLERDLHVPDGVVQGARELLALGVRVVICSLGGDGAIVVTANEGDWRAYAPTVDVVSPVGAGDAMVAGYAAAWARGLDVPNRIRWGVAAGTASAESFAAVPEERTRVAELARQVRVEPIADTESLFESAETPTE